MNWWWKQNNRTHPRRRSVLLLFAVPLHVDPLDGAAGGAHLRVAAARVRIWAARGWKGIGETTEQSGETKECGITASWPSSAADSSPQPFIFHAWHKRVLKVDLAYLSVRPPSLPYQNFWPACPRKKGSQAKKGEKFSRLLNLSPTPQFRNLLSFPPFFQTTSLLSCLGNILHVHVHAARMY